MMQHLTPDMLAELTPEAKERLRKWWKWWKPQRGDWTFFPLLSIGQLIELLHEHKKEDTWNIEWWQPMGAWFVMGYDDPELIRTLWDVAKAVLELEA